jgi:hypothetical protein
MAQLNRAAPFTACAGNGAVGSGLSGASVGVKLSYTVPAGRTAMLRYIGVANFSGNPTVQLRVTYNAITVVISSGTVAQNQQPNISLNAGDIVDLNVSASIAASTFDGVISAEEFN